MKSLTILALILTSLALTADAFAQRGGRRFGPGPVAGPGNINQQIVLNLNGMHYQGQSIIPLKQLINQQHPRMRLNQMDLLRVRLVSKSRNGGGAAALSVGGISTYEQRIYGQPSDFNSNAPRTYDKLVFENPNHNNQGAWQIHLGGNIKVLRIVVVVRDAAVAPRPPRQFTTNMDCSSWNHSYATCATTSTIVDANVLVQHSQGQKGACIKNQTFGFHDRTLWVNQGCRATFSVTQVR